MHFAEMIGFGTLLVSVVSALVIAVWKLSNFSATFSESIRVLSERLNEIKQDRASVAMVNSHAAKLSQLEAVDVAVTAKLNEHHTRLTVLEDWRRDWRSNRGSRPFIDEGDK